jgi:GAF domain-containing protein/HAMP domain-containing protein
MNRQSLRTRLIFTFLGVVLLSLSGISLMLVIANTRAAQQENERQLSTIASYKGKSIREWANALQAELGNVLVGENIIPNIQTVIRPPVDIAPTQRATDKLNLRRRLLNLVAQSRYYQEYMILDPDGIVAISSLQPRDGRDFSETDFYIKGQDAAYIGAPIYNSAMKQTILYVAYPIYSEGRQLVGVLVGLAETTPLINVFNDPTGFREPGQTYLAGLEGTIIAGSNPAWLGKNVAGLKDELAIQPPLEAPLVANYNNVDQASVTAAYLNIPELRGVLVIEQTQQDLLRSQLATMMVDMSVILSSVVLALYIALSSTRSIANPIADLADIAANITSIARGSDTQTMPTAAQLSGASQDLRAQAVSRNDEIGVLAQAFEGMTDQLAGLIGNLENIVDERTRQLETRSAYLEASADVSRVTTSILDPDRLIDSAVEMIRDRFDLYYVGLFLADRESQWAVLRSGTGEAGRAMLGRGHRLRIEPRSMIGWCISNAQARIAQVAGEDEVRVTNPELPDTRSEAALPLRARGQVIGALSVQSTRYNAFDSASLAVLQTMADQLAIAIENAQLYAQSQQALESQRRAYALSSQAEWRDWLTQSAGLRSGLTIKSDAQGPAVTNTVWYPEMQQAYLGDEVVQSAQRLAIPIRVRGAVIGVINTTRQSSGSWTSHERSFLEAIAEQLGVALDSARLYAETRQRAEQDRLVDDLTSRMRATLDLRSVLETAAREMRDALNLAEVEVRLGEVEKPHD